MESATAVERPSGSGAGEKGLEKTPSGSCPRS